MRSNSSLDAHGCAKTDARGRSLTISAVKWSAGMKSGRSIVGSWEIMSHTGAVNSQTFELFSPIGSGRNQNGSGAAGARSIGMTHVHSSPAARRHAFAAKRSSAATPISFASTA